MFDFYREMRRRGPIPVKLAEKELKGMFRFISVFFLILLLATHGARATVTVSSRDGEVWLGNMLVLRVNSSSVGDVVARRLKRILRDGISPSQIRIDKSGRYYTLLAGRLPIIVVTPGRARMNHSSTRSLAFLWAQRLENALAKGTYLITPTRLTVPYGETRELPITGRYPGGLSVEVQDPSVSNLVGDQIPLLFQGLKPGVTRVKISVGHLSAYTHLYVKKWAGSVPARVMLTVTGKEVPRRFLKRAISNLLYHRIPREDGARLSVKMPNNSLPMSLTSGQNMVFPVKATIAGSAYLPVKKKLMMEIQDKPFTPPTPAYLVVSNNPENFEAPGTLFRRSFPADKPARIFFHHHNKGTTPYRLVLRLSNPEANNPVSIHVVESVAGPDPNEIYVGGLASLQYFDAIQDGLGQVVEIGSGDGYTLVSKRIPPGQSLSGVLLLTPLNPLKKEKFLLKTVVLEQGENERDHPTRHSINEEERSKPRGIFENPEITIDAAYTVGGHYTFIEIGKDHILTDPDTGKPDYGNYGVVYKVNVAFTNPSATQATAHLMFVPQAGPATGVFVMNGELLRVPLVQPFTPYPLAKVELNPGETKTVTLKTMPAGGSFYPVNLVAEP